MREVLISIQPRWVEKIVSGEKTVEVRRTRPKCEVPFKCYIYCTMPKNKHDNLVLTPFGYDVGSESAYCNYTGNSNGKVIGEFVCDKIYNLTPHFDKPDFCNQYLCDWKWGEETACLSFTEMNDYLKGKNGYGWHITDLVVYDEPRELSEFKKPCNKKCNECENLDVSEIGAYEHTKEIKTCLNWITRPPQSWCYVKAKEPRQTADLRQKG